MASDPPGPESVGTSPPSAFAEQSPAHTRWRETHFSSLLLGRAPASFFHFPYVCSRLGLLCSQLSSAPVVPQGLVLLLRAHQEWEVLEAGSTHCPS